VSGCDALPSRLRWFAVPQPTEWEHIGNQIDAAMILALADFVSLDADKQPDVPKKA